MRKILVGLLLVFGISSYGQSVTGTSGLIHIPSARMLEDGQLVLGAAYIPKPYFQRYGRSVNPGLNTYITYGILPYVEVMFRYTHELNEPTMKNGLPNYFPDRMFSIRFRIINEKQIIPSIVIGFEDISALIGNTCLGCSLYNKNYLVISKSIDLFEGVIDLSLGHYFDLHKSLNNPIGLFYGGEFRHKKFSILVEFDSEKINTGVKYNLFPKINIMYGSFGLEKNSLTLNYIF